MLYVVYFCLVALIPSTHSHTADLPSENASLSLAFNEGKCCELHESSHEEDDDHHIHFLVENQTSSARYNQDLTSPALQNLAVAAKVNFDHYLRGVVGATAPISDFHQEALRPIFSGLSPPLS